MTKLYKTCLLAGLLLMPALVYANDPGILTFMAKPEANGSMSYSLSFKILLAMSAVTLLPALLMTLTSFTRIIIVLAILRQAIGMPNIPTNQICFSWCFRSILGLALGRSRIAATKPILSGRYRISHEK